jgi:hypothetical protein
MYWKHVHHLDTRARLLADRHYSRQTPGAKEIAPPGNKIVLLGLNDDALWVSHRPDPKANLAVPRADGFLYWNNPYFRNESGQRASDLILEALAITRYLWGDDVPRDGYHSFIDPRKVKPMMRRGIPTYGYTYTLAGFEFHSMTKSRGLMRFVLPREQLLAVDPLEPIYEQMSLFEVTA